MNQPHKLAMAWTVSWTLASNQEGHFYNLAYGIWVRGGSDSFVAWDPSHFHGTSLQDYSPISNMVSEFYQVGLAIVTPNCIPGLWKKYVMQQVTLEQAKEGVLSNGENDDCLGWKTAAGQCENENIHQVVSVVWDGKQWQDSASVTNSFSSLTRAYHALHYSFSYMINMHLPWGKHAFYICLPHFYSMFYMCSPQG